MFLLKVINSSKKVKNKMKKVYQQTNAEFAENAEKIKISAENAEK